MSGSGPQGPAGRSVPIDWTALRAAAAEVALRAYAPYSQFRVGAAGLVVDRDQHAVVVGCNVENISYGLTLCAECGLVSALHASGHGGQLVAVAVCGPEGDDIASCGRCRQLLQEAGGPDLLVNERPMRHWLPGPFDAFDPEPSPGGD